MDNLVNFCAVGETKNMMAMMNDTKV